MNVSSKHPIRNPNEFLPVSPQEVTTKNLTGESDLRPRRQSRKSWARPQSSQEVTDEGHIICCSSEVSGGIVICPETQWKGEFFRSGFAESDANRPSRLPSQTTRSPIRLSHCEAPTVKVYSAVPQALIFFFFAPEICGLGNLFFIFN